jgi:hypothetical protein
MALSDFLARHNVSGRLAAYRATAPTKEMLVAGIEQVLEVGLTTGAVGALEQRYGEQKTTLFMSDATDAAGNPQNDAQGNVIKKSGTGIPMSAAGAVLGIAATALLPMTPGWRRRTLNIASGFLSAWSYRKGIEMGQKWLDSKQPPGTPAMDKPMPPYTQSAQAQAEIANVKGEDPALPSGNVHSLVDRANAILKEQLRVKAASGR